MRGSQECLLEVSEKIPGWKTKTAREKDRGQRGLSEETNKE